MWEISCNAPENLEILSICGRFAFVHSLWLYSDSSIIRHFKNLKEWPVSLDFWWSHNVLKEAAPAEESGCKCRRGAGSVPALSRSSDPDMFPVHWTPQNTGDLPIMHFSRQGWKKSSCNISTPLFKRLQSHPSIHSSILLPGFYSPLLQHSLLREERDGGKEEWD